MNKKLLACDLDGTLIDSLREMNISFNHALKEVGVEEQEDLLQYTGMPLEEIFEIVLPDKKKNLVEEASASYRKKYSEIGPTGSPTYQGVMETLETLKKFGIKLAIATTKKTYMAELVAEGVGIAKYFDVILGEDLVEKAKPAPDIVELAIKRTGVSKEKTVFVGDMIYDVGAGLSAGVVSVWASYGFGSRESLRETEPDFEIKNFSELEEIIRNL